MLLTKVLNKCNQGRWKWDIVGFVQKGGWGNRGIVLRSENSKVRGSFTYVGFWGVAVPMNDVCGWSCFTLPSQEPWHAALAHKLHSSSPPPLASSSFCSHSSECSSVSTSISQDFSMESYVSFIVFQILPYLLKHVSEISNLNSPTGGTF